MSTHRTQPSSPPSQASGGDDVARLEALLRRIDGGNYGAYKQLRGRWRLDNCDLRVDRVQGDPFAAPSAVALLVDAPTAALPSWALTTPARRVSAADFLLRGLVEVARRVQRDRGSGRSGAIGVTAPGQEVLARTAVQVWPDGSVEARLRVGLPASGRRVLGRQAAGLLLDDLPDLTEHALRADTLDLRALRAHLEAVEDQQHLRAELRQRGLVAFIADGAHLPRRSGIDPRPLDAGGVVPFAAPDTMAITLTAPHAGPLRGMAIPEGLTLIVGGGYHGKSTLLRALALGVYDHIPGDGRERVVARDDAVKVRAEDGRAVTDLDISFLIGALPGGTDTRHFTTVEASGSTSQAAAIAEARAVGSDLLLIDEDTSATNLLIRDARMAALVSADKEPITPLVQRVGALRAASCSLVLVVGGTGDYFGQADRVIWMDRWRAVDATARAHALVKQAERDGPRSTWNDAPLPEAQPAWQPMPWRPAPKRLTLRDRRGRQRVRAEQVRRLTVGEDEVDLRAVEQLAAPGQAVAAGLALKLVRAALEAGAADLQGALATALGQLQSAGLDRLSDTPRGDLAAPRVYEIAAVIARLRGGPPPRP